MPPLALPAPYPPDPSRLQQARADRAEREAKERKKKRQPCRTRKPWFAPTGLYSWYCIGTAFCGYAITEVETGMQACSQQECAGAQRAHTHAHTHTHRHTHIRAHTQTCTYTHICTYTQAAAFWPYRCLTVHYTCLSSTPIVLPTPLIAIYALSTTAVPPSSYISCNTKLCPFHSSNTLFKPSATATAVPCSRDGSSNAFDKCTQIH